MNIKIKQLHQDSIIPIYKSEGASGFDFHSIEEVEIKPKDIAQIKTGLAFEIPLGYEMQIRPRSGLALNHGISVLNTPGTIDSDYRGEVIIILINFSNKIFVVNKGQRIAQGVIASICRVNFEISTSLESTSRGIDGFGSTGL